MQDAKDIIQWLAESHALFGASWMSINALILSMQHTPFLESIFVMHASDDLFYNYVHYIHCVKHMDSYALGVDHSNTLPASSHVPFVLDEQTPWLYTSSQRSSSVTVPSGATRCTSLECILRPVHFRSIVGSQPIACAITKSSCKTHWCSSLCIGWSTKFTSHSCVCAGEAASVRSIYSLCIGHQVYSNVLCVIIWPLCG